MFNIFKNPKLTFTCIIPEVAKMMPIEPANKVQYNWSNKMLASLRDNKNSIRPGEILKHVARCPGIAQIARTGWIQKSYQDIYIKTDGTGGFEWRTPIDQLSMISYPDIQFPYVSHHDASNTEPYGFLPNDTLKTVIKIQSPWLVYVPKGYSLLCLPIPYNDDTRFTASFGVIDGDGGVVNLNVQLFWHVLQGEEVISAGTPLAQYILIKKQKIKVEVTEADQNTVKDFRARLLSIGNQFYKNITNSTEKK